MIRHLLRGAWVVRVTFLVAMSDSLSGEGGWDKSAGSWMRLMEKGDPHRELLLDAEMRTLCDEVDGREVLDVCCGEGSCCRMLEKRGANVQGVIPTKELIAGAKRLQPGAIFHVAKAESLPVADASMDLVVSYLSLLDIPDYKAAITEMKLAPKPEVLAKHEAMHINQRVPLFCTMVWLKG